MSTSSGASSTRHPVRRIVAAVASAALVATGLATAGAAVAAPTAPAAVGGISRVAGTTTLEPGRYIVTLADDAAATYEGGVDGMARTKPDEGDQLDAQRRSVQTYADYLAETQRQVADAVGATIDYSYTLALNGFAADLTVGQLAALSRDKSVVSLTKDELLKPTLAVPSTDFLGLSGENGVWNATGGVETAGEGVVLGVIDSGIAPENPSFAGDALGTAAGDEPYYSGAGTTSFDKADGGTFTGVCQTGVQFTLDDCTTKLVGARYFVAGFDAETIGGVDIGEYLSPRDGDGHGSHTASTAVGNAGVETTVAGRDFGPISGMAPAAKVAAYKVCWEGVDPAVTTDDGCATSDSIAAIEAAVEDGVDALNFSIGGGAATSTVSPTDQAFLGAAAAGVFVAASAGNDGPGPSTLDNAAPWITTVGASTIPGYEGSVVLGDGQQFAGASISVNQDAEAEPLTGPLVTAASVALAGAATPELCGPGVLDPALTAGNIVLCDRGVVDRVAKSAEVARAGGIGMVLVNVTPSSIDSDAHSVPTVHLDAGARDALYAYAATPDPTVTLVVGNVVGSSPPTPQMAGFSSRGPVLADGSDILKPDITAPGVAILADGANAEGEEPTWQIISGTSMSSPHIAGLAVLYLGERPNATPGEIKSAMMTTAYDTVDGAGAPVTDPFSQGAGHVDPTEFFEPGFVYLNGPSDWLSYIEGLADFDVTDPAVEAIAASDLNLASIAVGELTAPQTVTRTATSTQAGTFTAQVAGLPGIDTTVEPSTLTFGAAGETQSYEVTFTRTDAPLDDWVTGALDWTSGDTVVHSPVVVQPVTIVAPTDASGTGVTGSTDIVVTPGGDGDIPLSTTGLTPGVLQADPTGATTEHSGVGATGDVFEYTVEVPEGTEYARFDLDSIDDTNDLDLYVDLLDDAGEVVGTATSATGDADERVNLREPDAGTYRVTVDLYSAAEGSAFDLFTFAVAPGGTTLTLTPPVISGVAGEPATVTASWTDLTPLTSYLGEITYGETGASTLLEVVTGEAPAPDAPVATTPPTISGNPAVGKKLTATPGEWDVVGLDFAYQWQVDGVDIPGATRSTYRPVASDQGKALTVVVTATSAELPPGTATSAPVTVKYTSTTTLSLSRSVFFSWQRTTATIKVDTIGDTTPAGKVVVSVDGRVRGQVAVEAGSGGTVRYQLPTIGSGVHVVQARFVPADPTTVTASRSGTKLFWVIF